MRRVLCRMSVVRCPLSVVVLLFLPLIVTAQDGDSGEPEPVRLGPYIVTGAVELGWRFTALDGNRDYYRSQVDLQRGPHLAFSRIELRNPDDAGPVFDKLLVEGSGWGGEPNSSARVRAEKRGAYVADYVHRRVDSYNFIPDFANPAFRNGVILAPHGWDRTRWMQTLNVTVFPYEHVEGRFTYDDSRQSGLALGTYSDIPSLIYDRDLNNRSREVRGGVSLRWPRWFLNVEQGFRWYDDDEVNTANPGTTLDPETLAAFSRRRTTDWDAPTTRATFTAEPVDDLRLTARVVYTDFAVEGTLAQTDDAEGSDPNSQDVDGRLDGHAFLFDSVQSYRFLDRFTLRNFVRYRRYRYVGTSAGRFVSNNVVENTVREDDVRSLRIATTAVEPMLEVDVARGLVARVGYRFASRDSFFDRADVVTLPETFGGGILVDERLYTDDYRADVFLAGGSYRVRHDARLFFEYENGREPSTFFGTQNGVVFFDKPGDYQLLRVRGMIRPRDWIQIDGSVRLTDRTFHSGPLDDLFEQEDDLFSGILRPRGASPSPAVPVTPDLEPPLQQISSHAAGITIRLEPDPRITFGLTYDHVHNKAGITYQAAFPRRDGTVPRATLFRRYVGDEDLITADVTAHPHERVVLYGLYSLVSVAGDVPVHYHQAQLRGAVRIGRGVSGVLEWRLYDYQDTRYDFAAYSANHAIAGLRWEW
jgi:hypothetical protein